MVKMFHFWYLVCGGGTEERVLENGGGWNVLRKSSLVDFQFILEDLLRHLVGFGF